MKLSVSAILSEKYGLTARPGAKVECPFCKHKTFAIKGDDSLGKCFHPSCGRFITPAQHKGQHDSSLSQILEEIFHCFHKALLEQKDTDHSNAHSYLVQERGIHTQVVADCMLGVVPVDYDPAGVFNPFLERAKVAVEAEKENRKTGRGRPKKDMRFTSQDRLKFLREAQDKLYGCIKNRTGWLCFFYTDWAHRIVAIRFREPYSDRMAYFKPYAKTAGLFGHGLFRPYRSKRNKHLNELLIVTEGEFNQLQLQSLNMRYWEALGEEADYLFACAVGGVQNTDYETIRKTSSSPVICYDHDTDQAGFGLVEKARLSMSVTAFTTPKLDTDLDQFIRSFGRNHKAAWKAVKKLIEARKPYPRDYEGLKQEIFITRQKRGSKDSRREFEINTEVSEIIRKDLHQRGKFYNDGQTGYFFFEADKRLVEIDQDDQECTLMLACYGINRSEALYRYLMEELRVEALQQGTKTDVHRLACYNPQSFTLYVFNHDNQIYRISPEKIELVDNGSDGVLFLADSRAEPFKVGKRNGNHSPLHEVIISKIKFAEDFISLDERQAIFILWFFCLFFESIMRTKPILALVGVKGSGKSITARKVGMLLFGGKFNTSPLSKDPKDFDAAVTNSYYVALDNVDGRSDWLNNRLATVATGGNISKRELYTTNRLVEIPTHCFLAITSRNPHFRRDDVADRLLIMKLERFDTFKPENVLLDEVIARRDEIMTEVVYRLQEIVQLLRQYEDGDASGAYRMADFSDFAMKIARDSGLESEVNAIFAKLTREQSSFALEGDQIFDLLTEWAEANPKREITNANLCGELAALAERKRIEFFYKGKARSFAQRMRNLRANLGEFFEITKHQAGGRKILYSFIPRKEIQEQ